MCRIDNGLQSDFARVAQFTELLNTPALTLDSAVCNLANDPAGFLQIVPYFEERKTARQLHNARLFRIIVNDINYCA